MPNVAMCLHETSLMYTTLFDGDIVLFVAYE